MRPPHKARMVGALGLFVGRRCYLGVGLEVGLEVGGSSGKMTGSSQSSGGWLGEAGLPVMQSAAGLEVGLAAG